MTNIEQSKVEAKVEEADDETVARLSALTPEDYDRSRKDAAAKLGVRVGTLDTKVKAARGQSLSMTSEAPVLPNVEPWHEPVSLDDLLAKIVAALRRHVVLPPDAAEAVGLWIAHTWVYGSFEHTPRLRITSPARQCGKSTLLEVLRILVRRPVKVDNITTAGVFRAVDELSPLSLLIDEVDTFLTPNSELRGVLNSGFEKSGQVIRTVETQGVLHLKTFKTYSPVALAGIGTIPSTLEDRSVPIQLQRKGFGDLIEKLRENGNRQALAVLARKLARWALDDAAMLSTNPSMPADLGDREADICVPLVSIADAAGGAWPEQARRALTSIFKRRAAANGNTDTAGALLADIRAIFQVTGHKNLCSAVICARLAQLEERPWPEWKNAKPITPVQLAALLRDYSVNPKNIKQPNGKVAKGYLKADFHEVWARYLPPSREVPSP